MCGLARGFVRKVLEELASSGDRGPYDGQVNGHVRPIYGSPSAARRVAEYSKPTLRTRRSPIGQQCGDASCPLCAHKLIGMFEVTRRVESPRVIIWGCSTILVHLCWPLASRSRLSTQRPKVLCTYLQPVRYVKYPHVNIVQQCNIYELIFCFSASMLASRHFLPFQSTSNIINCADNIKPAHNV